MRNTLVWIAGTRCFQRTDVQRLYAMDNTVTYKQRSRFCRIPSIQKASRRFAIGAR
jgi:hypothetical protein